MQKKNYSSESASSWEQNLKKEQRNSLLKKIALWGAVLAVCITGLAALVIYADKSTTSTNSVVENSNLPGVREGDIVLGNRNAKVTITEYADYQCPACASYNPMVNMLLEEYGDRISVVFRHFPLRSVHKNAIIAGQAIHAANELGKFKEMKDLLYTNQPEWENLGDPRETFESYAQSIGLDVEEFRNIMNSDEAKKTVEDGEREAIGLGLQSTPTFFIGNKQFSPRTYDEFKKLIDEELSGTVTQKPLQ